jgi:hypothetical protein
MTARSKMKSSRGKPSSSLSSFFRVIRSAQKDFNDDAWIFFPARSCLDYFLHCSRARSPPQAQTESGKFEVHQATRKPLVCCTFFFPEPNRKREIVIRVADEVAESIEPRANWNLHIAPRTTTFKENVECYWLANAYTNCDSDDQQERI